MTKVIVIGLDGVCLDFLLPWINRGELPYLEKLLGSGVYSELQSTIPPYTAPAWISLVTGKNPAKHGVFDFFKAQGQQTSRTLVSSLDNNAETIWDYLSEAGKRCIVINMPITHPARRINGILIPGYLAPEPPTCYPPDILRKVEQALGEYRIYSKNEDQRVSPKKKLQGYMEVTKLRKDAAIFLGKKYGWDFLMVQFQKTDAVFHDFVNEKYILTFYKFIDQCIRELVEALAADATTFLVSDHGMGKWDYIFYVNSWLRKEGYLQTRGLETHRSSLELEKERLTGADVSSIRYHLFNKLMNCLARTGISGERVGSWLSSLHMGFLRSMVPSSLIAKVPRVAIDEESSLAYCPSSTSFGLKIKLHDNDRYQGFRNHLIEKLRTITGPKGTVVFDSVLPREEYYHGPYIDSAPDILLVPKEMTCVVSDSVFDKNFLAHRNYSHRINGFFTGASHDIANSGYLGTVLSIFDIAPTILHIMGLPVPDDMDGRVLKELFKEDSEPAQRAVEYKATSTERKRARDRVAHLKKSEKI